MTWDQVRAANAAMQEALLEMVVQIMADHREDPAKRTRVLAPIMAQHQKISEAHSRKRKVKDVDPITGEEQDETEPEPVTA